MMTRKLIGMWALAGALIFMVAAESDALSCKDPKACTNSSYCTDSCTLDSASGTGVVSCAALNPGGCIKCWTADVDTVIGVHSNLVVTDHISRNEYFTCSNGSSTFIRNECVTKVVGVCLSNCPDYGARCN
jgi:hypothetical protein